MFASFDSEVDRQQMFFKPFQLKVNSIFFYTCDLLSTDIHLFLLLLSVRLLLLYHGIGLCQMEFADEGKSCLQSDVEEGRQPTSLTPASHPMTEADLASLARAQLSTRWPERLFNLTAEFSLTRSCSNCPRL